MVTGRLKRPVLPRPVRPRTPLVPGQYLNRKLLHTGDGTLRYRKLVSEPETFSSYDTYLVSWSAREYTSLNTFPMECPGPCIDRESGIIEVVVIFFRGLYLSFRNRVCAKQNSSRGSP